MKPSEYSYITMLIQNNTKRCSQLQSVECYAKSVVLPVKTGKEDRERICIQNTGK